MISAFQLLNIAPPATRAEIERAREDAGFDERASDEVLQKAVDALTTPMSRLREEVAYFWGMSRAEIEKLPRLCEANTDVGLFCQSMEKASISSLAKANLAAYFCGSANSGLVIMSMRNVYTMADDLLLRILTDALLSLIDVQKSIDAEAVGELINSARKKSRVVPLAKHGDIEVALDDLRKKHLEAAGIALCKARYPGKLAAEIAEQYRHNKRASGDFVKDLLRGPYTRWAHAHMEPLEKEIDRAVATLRESPDDEQALCLIEKKLPVWDEYAQPLQLIDEGMGFDDKRSKEICNALIDLAMHINNTAELPEVSFRIVKVLNAVFKELPGVAERLADDLTTLEGMAGEKQKAQRVRQQLTALVASVKQVQNNESAQIPALLTMLSALLGEHAVLAKDEKLWFMVRSAALSLHNTHHETVSAIYLTGGILARARQFGAPVSVIAKLLEDEGALNKMYAAPRANAVSGGRDDGDVMAYLGPAFWVIVILVFIAAAFG